MTDNAHSDNYTHAIATRRGNILCSSNVQEIGMLDEYGDSKDLTDIHYSLVSQTFSVRQRRSLSVCGTRREA